MGELEAISIGPGKVSRGYTPSSLDVPLPRKPLTKKRIRRIAEPHIRAHQVKGHVYYYYVRGVDKEIYLGDADAILRAVKRQS